MMPPNKVKNTSPMIQILARVEYKYKVDCDVDPCSELLGIATEQVHTISSLMLCFLIHSFELDEGAGS